jgi:hypothetical protein
MTTTDFEAQSDKAHGFPVTAALMWLRFRTGTSEDRSYFFQKLILPETAFLGHGPDTPPKVLMGQ